MVRKLMTWAAVSALAVTAATASGQEGATVLMVSARYTMVQFGMDAVSLRPVILMCYSGTAASDNPVLHVWNTANADWSRVSLDTYRSGGLFRASPSRIVVVGTDADLPASILDASQAIAPVKRVNSLGIVGVVNALDETERFTTQEWRWLAGRYGLTLEDRNYDRRRYGKYGAPGSRRAAPAAEAPAAETSETLTPVPLEEAPAAAPVESPAAEPATVEKTAPPAAAPADVLPENK
jgi:hypothetical protein